MVRQAGPGTWYSLLDVFVFISLKEEIVEGLWEMVMRILLLRMCDSGLSADLVSLKLLD